MSEIEAYCGRCSKQLNSYSELFFINYQNKKTSLRCKDCFENIGEDLRANAEADRRLKHFYRKSSKK